MSGSPTSEPETTVRESETRATDRPCVCRTESCRFCPCYSTRTWQRGDPTTDLPTAPLWRPSQHRKMSDAA
jgi:hypothetical protein